MTAAIDDDFDLGEKEALANYRLKKLNDKRARQALPPLASLPEPTKRYRKPADYFPAPEPTWEATHIVLFIASTTCARCRHVDTASAGTGVLYRDSRSAATWMTTQPPRQPPAELPRIRYIYTRDVHACRVCWDYLDLGEPAFNCILQPNPTNTPGVKWDPELGQQADDILRGLSATYTPIEQSSEEAQTIVETQTPSFGEFLAEQADQRPEA